MYILAASPDVSPLLALAFFIAIPVALVWALADGLRKRRKRQTWQRTIDAADRDRLMAELRRLQAKDQSP